MSKGSRFGASFRLPNIPAAEILSPGCPEDDPTPAAKSFCIVRGGLSSWMVLFPSSELDPARLRDFSTSLSSSSMMDSGCEEAGVCMPEIG